MNANLEYLKMFLRFPFSLRRFLRHRLTLDEAERLAKDRMKHREDNFLRLVERAVFAHPPSPYLALLKMAGCDLGDLRALVGQKGLEGALKELRTAGVYVTYEEIKGRKPIVRNQFRLEVTPRDFNNPLACRDFESRTSGSTGLAQTVSQNLDSIADAAVFRMLALHSYGLLEAPMVLWSPFLPSSASFRAILMGAQMGDSVRRWFAPTGWGDSKYWYKYDPATVYMIACFWLFGHRAPFPQIVRIDHAETVARDLHKMCKRNPFCIIHTSMSRALRICLAAREENLDLTRCVVWGGAEPATQAKIEQIRSVCGRFLSSYAMTEAGNIGYSCNNATDPTDVHLKRDGLALFTFPYEIENIGITVPAFNITTLTDSSSKLLFNVQMDDYGIVEERSCGCELEKYGYTTHIRDIRSYGKLVGEGVTLIGNEISQVLEKTLPARFGGSYLDYQLLEQEDSDGFTRLNLVIHPRIKIPDEQKVLDELHKALSASSPMGDGVRTIWKQAHTIQIKRQEPILTESGKFLPLLLRGRSAKPGNQ
jgi:hypothetical protein